MQQDDRISEKIEQLRKKMYQAYESNESYETILRISQELDTLLNKHNHSPQHNNLSKDFK